MNSQRAVLSVVLVICLYFELIVAARCYADWNQWLLKSRIGLLRAEVIFDELENQSPEVEARSWQMAVREKRFSSKEEEKAAWGVVLKKFEEKRAKIELASEFEEFESRFRASSNIRRARLLLETWFPLLFGCASMILATIRIATSST